MINKHLKQKIIEMCKLQLQFSCSKRILQLQRNPKDSKKLKNSWKRKSENFNDERLIEEFERFFFFVFLLFGLVWKIELNRLIDWFKEHKVHGASFSIFFNLGFWTIFVCFAPSHRVLDFARALKFKIFKCFWKFLFTIKFCKNQHFVASCQSSNKIVRTSAASIFFFDKNLH